MVLTGGGGRFGAAVIMKIAYGHQIESDDDEYIKLAVEAMDVLNETHMTGKYWVEFMPFIRHFPTWVPGAASVKFGARWKPVVLEMVNRPFDAVKNDPVS